MAFAPLHPGGGCAWEVRCAIAFGLPRPARDPQCGFAMKSRAGNTNILRTPSVERPPEGKTPIVRKIHRQPQRPAKPAPGTRIQTRGGRTTAKFRRQGRRRVRSLRGVGVMLGCALDMYGYGYTSVCLSACMYRHMSVKYEYITA